MAEHTTMSRRVFVLVSATALGGLAVGVRMISRRHAQSSSPDDAFEPNAFEPNAFVRVEPDGTVVVIAQRPEMGQGVRTALAMLVAEELDADWTEVRVEQADLNEARYGPQYAGGSAVVRTSWDPLRQAGATARAILVAAAAAEWRVDVGQCRTEQSSVVHVSTGRRLGYGALVPSARTMPVPQHVKVKDPGEYRIIGRPTPSIDVGSIVRGASVFGIDVRVPGMLVASIERSPVFGGRVVRVDDRAARAAPGVQAVVTIDADALPAFDENSPKMPNGVAVVARSTWEALQGRQALRVEWDLRGGEVESTARMRQQAIMAARTRPRMFERRDGDVARALAGAVHRLEAVYELPLLAHAPMEPMNCTADVRDDRCEIWAPTQHPQGARDVAARITGLPAARITVHLIRMGGAFGRRFYADFVGEAVCLSKVIRRPVQVVWTREDDIRHDFYRPAAYHLMRAGLDGHGKLIAWSQHLVNASRGHYLGWKPPNGHLELDPGEVEPYDVPANLIPNMEIGYTPLDSTIPRGQWRAVESSATVFVTQGFLDEVAHAARWDPVAFQLALIGQPRALKYYDATYDSGRLATVLRVAADRGSWGRPLPRGSGRGIAASYSNSAYVAHVVEVTVSSRGDVRVTRVVSVVDCGIVVNPLGARAQVEGGVLFGLSAALKQEITIKAGRVEQGNFNDFQTLRIHEAPRHDIHFIPSTDPVRGMGECALPGVAPALTNAIFAATDVRVRRLPIGQVQLGAS